MRNGLPIIDLAAFRDGGAALAELADRIGAACRDVGFFYVVNHGVERALINEAFAQSRRFFALPLAEREAIAIETVGGNRGYSGLLSNFTHAHFIKGLGGKHPFSRVNYQVFPVLPFLGLHF